jgi:hypothetical protein
MDAVKVGQAGLSGWREKVADGVAAPFEDHTPAEPDQVRAVVGALFFVLSVVYVVSTLRDIIRELRA